jgi:acetyl-CoA acetyltransferase
MSTDGGQLSGGQPGGAIGGFMPLVEAVTQLRGEAGDRQVPGEPKVGYAQLYGAPGTAGVSILSL